MNPRIGFASHQGGRRGGKADGIAFGALSSIPDSSRLSTAALTRAAIPNVIDAAVTSTSEGVLGRSGITRTSCRRPALPMALVASRVRSPCGHG